MIAENIPLDTDNEDQLGLIVNVEVALLAGSTGQADLLALSVAVLADVGLSTLEDNGTLLLVGLLDFSQQEIPILIGDKSSAEGINNFSDPKDG